MRGALRESSNYLLSNHAHNNIFATDETRMNKSPFEGGFRGMLYWN